MVYYVFVFCPDPHVQKTITNYIYFTWQMLLYGGLSSDYTIYICLVMCRTDTVHVKHT